MALSTFPIQVITPEGVVYNSQAERLTVSTVTGEITVLAKHTPLVSLLKPGELRIKKNGDFIPMAVAGGVLEVRRDGRVIVLADSVIPAEEIDRDEAERARARAEQIIKEREDLSDREYAELQSTIERELARIKVADKYSRK